MIRIATTLFSFETVFVLFLFAGRFKEDPRFSWVLVDLTLLFLVLSVAAGIVVLYKRRFRFRVRSLHLLGLVGGFLLFCGCTYFWTPSVAYALEKLGYLWVLTFWAFIACALIISRSTQRLKRFFLVLMIFSSWVVFEALVATLGSEFTGQQIHALGTLYLGLGRVIGLGAAVFLVYAIPQIRNRTVKCILFGLFLLHLAMLLVIGGRGPLIATILSLGVPVYFGFGWNVQQGIIKIRRYLRPIILIIVLTSVLIALFLPADALTTIIRLQALTSGDIGASAGIRVHMYSQALHVWAENPIWGAGIGGWPVLAGWGDRKMYPHNLVLEVLAEYGIVGLILLLVPILYAFHLFLKSGSPAFSISKITILALFINTFVNAMLTGDLSDNRVLFAVLGLLLYQDERVAPQALTQSQYTSNKGWYRDV